MPETQIEISRGKPAVANCGSRMSLCAECVEGVSAVIFGEFIEQRGCQQSQGIFLLLALVEELQGSIVSRLETNPR